MDVHDVALVVFGKLVSKDNPIETNAETHRETARIAYEFADAFMQASIDYRNKRASVAPARF